jgi:hypothetical protein
MEDDFSDQGNPEAAAEAAQAEDFARLMGMSVKEILETGQKALFADLVSRVRSGAASHQEKAILRNILKDTGLSMLGLAPDKDEPKEAPMELPEFPDPDYEA